MRYEILPRESSYINLPGLYFGTSYIRNKSVLATWNDEFSLVEIRSF